MNMSKRSMMGSKSCKRKTSKLKKNDSIRASMAHNISIDGRQGCLLPYKCQSPTAKIKELKKMKRKMIKD